MTQIDQSTLYPLYIQARLDQHTIVNDILIRPPCSEKRDRGHGRGQARVDKVGSAGEHER